MGRPLSRHSQQSIPDWELALVVLQDAHHAKSVLPDVVDALQEAAHLVHDLVVDGVLIIVLVVAPPDGEALWVIARKMLQDTMHECDQRTSV